MYGFKKRKNIRIIIKHDGVQRSLVGEIIGRIERTGLKISAMKMFKADEKSVLEHYGKDDAWCLEKGTKTVENLKSCWSSGRKRSYRIRKRYNQSFGR
ncbi:MAG: nucleoside-diphosphate kinase [Candidatus Paceibacterota bacterium]